MLLVLVVLRMVECREKVAGDSGGQWWADGGLVGMDGGRVGGKGLG